MSKNKTTKAVSPDSDAPVATVDTEPADDIDVLSYASSLPDDEAPDDDKAPEQPPAPDDEAPETDDEAPETVTVTGERVWVRSTPEKRKDRSNCVRVAVAGEPLTMVERRDDGWVQVEEGYIMAEFVR
jgi:hypothetical protein